MTVAYVERRPAPPYRLRKRPRHGGLPVPYLQVKRTITVGSVNGQS